MKFLNSCILFSSGACVQVAALSDQIFLSCESSDYDNKFYGERISPGIKTTGNKSFLDSYFGNFLDGVADAVTIKGKHEPLPLPDHVRNLAVHDNHEYPDPEDLRVINGSTVFYRGGEFGYIDTFAHLPLISCFDPELYEKEPLDIAVIGAPFNSGVSCRPGAQFGPSSIRLGSRRLAAACSV